MRRSWDSGIDLRLSSRSPTITSSSSLASLSTYDCPAWKWGASRLLDLQQLRNQVEEERRQKETLTNKDENFFLESLKFGVELQEKLQICNDNYGLESNPDHKGEDFIDDTSDTDDSIEEEENDEDTIAETLLTDKTTDPEADVGETAKPPDQKTNTLKSQYMFDQSDSESVYMFNETKTELKRRQNSTISHYFYGDF